MWDLVKEELGNQKKALKNIEISENRANIQDPKAIANVFNPFLWYAVYGYAGI
jgi:hypothetical protein